MKANFVLAALIAALSIPQFATANGGDKPDAEKQAPVVINGSGAVTVTISSDKGSLTISSGTLASGAGKGTENGTQKDKVAARIFEPQVTLENLKFGKVLSIGPDGKVEVKDFNGQFPKAMLDKLPKEIRENLQKGRPMVAFERSGFSGKIKVIVDKDGKRQEFEQDLTGAWRDPEGHEYRHGKRQEFEKNPGGPDSVKKAGQDLPPEAVQALEAAEQAMEAEEAARQEAIKARSKELTGQSKAADDIAAKLDKILERLERVEKDVKALKEKKDK